jgi:hypothetical protein
MHQLRVSRRPRDPCQPPPSASGKFAGYTENEDDRLGHGLRESCAERLKIQEKVEGRLEVHLIALSTRILEMRAMKSFPLALVVSDVEAALPSVM